MVKYYGYTKFHQYTKIKITLNTDSESIERGPTTIYYDFKLTETPR